MTTYRKYGGVKFSAVHSIARAHVLGADVVAAQRGVKGTTEKFTGNVNLDNNQLQNVNAVVFSDGTVQSSAATEEHWRITDMGNSIEPVSAANVELRGTLFVGEGLAINGSEEDAGASISSTGELYIDTDGPVCIVNMASAARLSVLADARGMSAVEELKDVSVDGLKAVSFDSATRLGARSFGLAGDAARKTHPDLMDVVGGQDTIDISGVVALLVHEVQQLRARIAKIESSNTP